MSRRIFTLMATLAVAVGTLIPLAGASERPDASDLTASVEGIELVSTDSRPAATINGGKLIPVVIVLDEDSVASYDGGITGLPATSPQATGNATINFKSPSVKKYRAHLKTNHANFEAQLKSKISRAEVGADFDIVIGGVTALVPANSLDAIAKMTGVQAVYLDTLEQIQTDASPQFIGADLLWDELGGPEMAGEGVIVGVLDTGIWPEHPSFSDPDPAGDGYPAPPVYPGANGTNGGRSSCDFGNTAVNPDDDNFTCNNKLIGAYNYTDTYRAVVGLLPDEYDSARDSDGHGTHTSSTAAGNGGVAASIFGASFGDVSGIAPRAHVVMYKVCQDQGCFGSDSALAVQQAILDGVDVINFSISGGSDPYGDSVSLAFLDAYNAGILVAPSAGNSGPGADTVAHREPWTMTVGASTTDRQFVGSVTLSSSDGDDTTFDGVSITGPLSTPASVVWAGDFGDAGCLGAFPAGTWTNGEIVVCDRGVIARVAKSGNVFAGGAGGFVLRNLQGRASSLAVDNHFVPAVHLSADTGDALMAYLGSYANVMGTLSGGVKASGQGDVMADFSSRGGPSQTLGISKPDVTAPGVQILAGHTPTPATINGGAPGQLFQAINGTSMSAPHATGAAALVKAAHPDWGPGQIRSALMMTAKTVDVYKEDGTTPADSFDYGSGRILPAVAAEATVTISASGNEYWGLADSLWDANYPSLYVPTMPGLITVDRTFHNETGRVQRFTVAVESPSDMVVLVGTADSGGGFRAGNGTMQIAAKKTTFAIHVDARNVPLGDTRTAMITFEPTGEGASVHFPVTIVRGEAPLVASKTCDPEPVALGDTTSCTITVENTLFDDTTVILTDELPSNLQLIKKSVEGAQALGNDRLRFKATLLGAQPPQPDVVVDPLASPFGYVSLSGFSPLDVGATDESIANFNIPSFEYAGEVYNQIGIVSNGYVVVGGGTGADVNFINSDLPDSAIPNNVLAPFWTDLNPAFGGRVLISVLSDGSDTWTVVEWESVANFGDGETNTFQIWIGTNTDSNPGEDISFVYGADISDGDGGFLTVGVENAFGNEGGTVYFDGAGTPPSPSFPAGTFEVDVFSIPGEPGASHTVTFDATAVEVGPYTNYVILESDAFGGDSVTGFSGNVIE